MPIAEIRIDEALWSSASELRRQEWRTLIADLLDEGPIAPASTARRLIVRMAAKTIVLELVGDDEIAFAEEVLAQHFDEYLSIIRKMVEDDISAQRLEALDMAKKVVHDRAGRSIQQHAARFADGLEPFRRLFSLLVALRVDTTSLPPAHRHRL